MSENTTEIAVTSTAPVSNIRAYSSIQGDDLETRLSLFSAVTTSEPLDTVLGVALIVSNVVILPVELLNEQSGELEIQPRISLVTEDGKAYHATSKTLHRDLTNLLTIAGQPAKWGRGLEIVIKKDGAKMRQYFTIASAKAVK